VWILSQLLRLSSPLVMNLPSCEFMPKYDATFGDERMEDSTDDRLVLELSNSDNILLQRGQAEHAVEV
jgi:hypothetical protein